MSDNLSINHENADTHPDRQEGVRELYPVSLSDRSRHLLAAALRAVADDLMLNALPAQTNPQSFSDETVNAIKSQILGLPQ